MNCSPLLGVQGEGVLSWSADGIADQKAPVSSTLLQDALCLRPRHILVVPAGEKEDASSQAGVQSMKDLISLPVLTY